MFQRKSSQPERLTKLVEDMRRDRRGMHDALAATIAASRGPGEPSLIHEVFASFDDVSVHAQG